MVRSRLFISFSLSNLLFVYVVFYIYTGYDIPILLRIVNSITDSSLNFLSILFWFILIYYVIFNKNSSIGYILIPIYLIIVSYLSPGVINSYTSLSNLSYNINLELFNGVLSIHPLILLLSYSYLFALLLCLSYFNFYSDLSIIHLSSLKLSNNLVMLNHTLINLKLSKVIFINLLAVVLGGYWAHQELSWGGYWSWDPIEMFSFFTSVFLIYMSHMLINRSSYYRPLIILIPLILYLFLTRINAIPSVHGFLDIQDLRFNLSMLTTLVTPVALIILFLTLSAITLNYYLKFENTLLNFNFLLLRIVLTFTIVFSIIYLIPILSVSSAKPVKVELISSLVLFIIIIMCISINIIGLLFYPMVEGHIVFNALKLKSLKLKLGTTHIIIVPMVLFFYLLSHIYFVSFFKSVNLSLGNYDKLASYKLSTLSTQVWHTLGMGNPIYNLNESYIFCYVDALFYSASVAGDLYSEQFSSLILPGFDQVSYGLNSFSKLTYTCIFFLLCLFILLSYFIRYKVYKNYMY